MRDVFVRIATTRVPHSEKPHSVYIQAPERTTQKVNVVLAT